MEIHAPAEHLHEIVCFPACSLTSCELQMDCCFGGILPDLSDVSRGPKETHVSKDLGNAVLFDFSDHAIGPFSSTHQIGKLFTFQRLFFRVCKSIANH